MKRPSRRLRESATTTLKKGRFLAPPRARRMTTMIGSRKDGPATANKKDRYSRPKTLFLAIPERSTHPRQHALHAPQHLLHAALGHHLHHLLRLLELTE